MELRHLRHFVTVAEELHFARAAERLGMEQSPLSHLIRNLEADVGVKLFQRTTRRTWLTRAGTRFYREARRILGDVDALADAVRREGVEEPEFVRLVLGEDLASEPFTRLMFELEHHSPKVNLEVRELVHAEAARLVCDGGADVAFTLNPRPEPELRQARAWSEPLMAIAAIGHPLAERTSVSVRELAGETIALPSPAECPGYVFQIEALLGKYDVCPFDRRNARHWNTAVTFAATGHAIALCPMTIIHCATAVAVIPIEEQADLVTWLLYREDEPSPAVSLVLEIAAEVERGWLRPVPLNEGG